MKPCVVKQYLTEAAFRLMEKKDYRYISVSELVNTAGVCRASFYRNYLCVESIVDEYLENTFKEIYYKYPMSQTNMRETILHIFAEIKSRRRYLDILKRQNLLDRMSRFLYDDTLKMINRLNVFNNRYQPHFFAGASFALIKAWIEYGFEESEQEMTDIFFKLLKGYL